MKLNLKVMGALLTMAALSAAAFAFAIFSVFIAEPAHAAINTNVGATVNVGTVGTMATGTNSVKLDAKVDTGASMQTTNNTTASTSETSGSITTSGNTGAEATTDMGKVENTEDHVAVSYEVPGRFLGIFPTNVPVTARVTSDGKVDVSHPWYTTISRSNEDTLKTRVNERVSAIVNANTMTKASSTDTTLSAQSRADLIIALKAAFENFKANLKTNATVETK